MTEITNGIALADGRIQQRFVRAAGDRGQNGNHHATAVELRLDVRRSPLPRDMQERLMALAGKHMTHGGVLVVVSRASRSQEENRESAHARLLALLRRAAKARSIRLATEIPRLARDSRLAAKHRKAAAKSTRKPPLVDRNG